jgi:putative addiction module component (TIGR02574 family)
MAMKDLGIERLSFEERLALVFEIWDSITAERQPLLTDALREELNRRIADCEANPDDCISWEEIKQDVLARQAKEQSASGVSFKEEARRLIEALPADATWQDLQEKISARQSIESGIKDSRAGRTVPIAEARRQFGLKSE